MDTPRLHLEPSSLEPRPRREWPIAAGLLLLAFVPSLAGAIRIGEIASGATETAANARFMQMPLPVLVHIIAALVYSTVGAFQFLPRLRRKRNAWHRFAGRYLLVPAGFLVAASGLWMTAFYDTPAIDDRAVAASRYLVGGLMLAFLLLGIAAIRRRDYFAHGSWMIRAYALALGAGTQVLTSCPPLLLFGEPSELARLLQMDAGWLINALVAEWVIARRRAASRRPATIAA
jgi:cytochrome bd-type quinol oxidase subunit 2